MVSSILAVVVYMPPEVWEVLCPPRSLRNSGVKPSCRAPLGVVCSDSWVSVWMALLSYRHVKQFFLVTFLCIEGGEKLLPIATGLWRGSPVLNPVVNDYPSATRGKNEEINKK